MALIEKKRKIAPISESFARSRNPSDKDNRPSKRARPDEERKSVAGSTKLSQGRDEDVAFPRGGASNLTPLEHKQIQIEATRDVLFELEQGAKENGEGGAVPPARKKSKSKGKSKKSNEQAQEEEESVKIERLSYKVFYFILSCNF